MSAGSYKGKFFVLEGIDGTGKSTIARRLANEFGLVHLFDPGSTSEALLIRKLLLETKGMEPSTRALLYIAARNEVTSKRIVPELQAGKNVIIERYSFSTMAYQYGVLPLNTMHDLHAHMPKPDKVILLETEPAIAMARDANPQEASIAGKDAHYFTDLIKKYREVVQGHNYTTVDVSGEFEGVYQNIVRILARENPDLFG